jgi:hypothetical protein
MDNTIIGETASVARTESPELCRLICLSCATLLFLMTALPAISRAQTQQQQAKPTGSEPSPEPAVPAILAAFDKYEVVGMPEAHGFKDVDDFILSSRCCGSSAPSRKQKLTRWPFQCSVP